MANIVQFENVGLRYGAGEETLCDVSFTLRSGQFYFLTGASGAGKTSLLRLLYLAQRPSRGIIRLFGEDAVILPRDRLPGFRRRIGVVFQDFRLIPHLSAADNIALPLRVAGMAESEIARAVIARPEMLVADEPTGNVDPAMAERLLHLFHSLHRLGTTVVMATHDWHLIDRVPGGHRLHLKRGRLVDPEPVSPPEPPRSTLARSGL